MPLGQQATMLSSLSANLLWKQSEVSTLAAQGSIITLHTLNNWLALSSLFQMWCLALSLSHI